MLQIESNFKWWNINGTFGYSKCRPYNSNEGVFIYKAPTGARNNRTTNRPSTQQLLYNLKQSLLWSNLSMDINCHMSQNILNTTLAEWYEQTFEKYFIKYPYRMNNFFSKFKVETSMGQLLLFKLFGEIVCRIKFNTKIRIKRKYR